MKRLLLTGTDSVHVYNYLQLVRGYFDEVLVIVQKSEKQRDYGVPVIALDFSLKNPLSASRTVSLIREQIGNFKPSVIHAHQANSIAYLTLRAASGTGIPTVLTTWGSDILLVPDMGIVYRRMVKYNLMNAGHFTSDSLHVAARMAALVPARPLDITIANFGIGTVPAQAVKENIVYSNRLHSKLYRLDKVIAAFEKFSKSRKNEGWKLVIAATGPGTADLRSQVEALGLQQDVTFAGWVDANANADLYNRAKIFVSVPESDGTAISLLEAMAAGCIPVVSNLPANTEWILDGINGVIVTNLEENFLEEAMRLDQEKARQLNAAIIAKKGTREVNAQKFIAMYHRILHNSR